MITYDEMLDLLADKGLEDGLKELSERINTERPDHMMTVIDGVSIGWYTCGTCSRHIKACECVNGPSEPGYLDRMRKKLAPSLLERITARAAEGDAPTTVSSGETPNRVSSSEGVVDLAKSESENEDTVVCGTCRQEVLEDQADPTDDGGYICFACQDVS